MTRWEYRHITITTARPDPSRSHADDLLDALNRLGQEGWEVYRQGDFVPFAGDRFFNVDLWLKRPVTD